MREFAADRRGGGRLAGDSRVEAGVVARVRSGLCAPLADGAEERGAGRASTLDEEDALVVSEKRGVAPIAHFEQDGAAGSLGQARPDVAHGGHRRLIADEEHTRRWTRRDIVDAVTGIADPDVGAGDDDLVADPTLDRP